MSDTKQQVMSVLFVAFLLLLLATGPYSRDKPARIDTEIAINYTEKVKPELPKQDEIRQIMQDEGYRSCRYKDTEGHFTIGFGHRVGKHSPKSKCISKDLAIALLEVD